MDLLILGLGAVLIAAATVLDFVFRLRMTRAGHKMALLLGGAFNYREYHKLRREHGWPAWPVYTMWVLITAGILLVVLGIGMRHGWKHP